MNSEKNEIVLTAAGAKRIISEMNPEFESRTSLRIIHIVYIVVGFAFITPIIAAIVKSI